MARRLTAQLSDFEWLTRAPVAVIGYGNQGRAQALNLRDSGLDVVIGQRPGASFDKAVADGFAPVPIKAAVAQAETLMITLPDETVGGIFQRDILAALRASQTLLFSHGFGVHFGAVQAPADVAVGLVSPKGQARGVRGRYLEGSGVPALIGIQQDPRGDALQTALGYAWGCGYARSVLLETSFREETETDLFGEQAVLCGGMLEIIKAGYEVLVEAGYDPEMAYFECVHETKLIIDLLVERGLGELRTAISDTAEFGGYVVGPKLVTEETRQEMRTALARIQSGEFAADWQAEAQNGKPRLRALRAAEAILDIQTKSEELRREINSSPTSDSR